MTVKSIPYWQQGPAWGEPGHEPWQKLPYPTNPKGRWGWWNDPSVTDEDIWRSSPENQAGLDLFNRLDKDQGPRMAGMFMENDFADPNSFPEDGGKTPPYNPNKTPFYDWMY